MTKNLLIAAFLVSGIALSATASAQTYVGGTVGKAKWDIDTSGSTSSKTSDTGVHVFGGYDFSPNLALEAGYFSVGKATATNGTLTGEFKGSGVDFAGVFKSSVNNGFSVFGKLGVAYVKGESLGKIGTVSGTLSSNSAQLLAGVGVTYKLNDSVSLRAEYERRNVKVADMSGATSTVSNISVGAQVAF